MNAFYKFTLLLVTISFIASCKNNINKKSPVETPESITYENDLFSIELPYNWICDDSRWGGLDSIQNEVDFYGPENCPVFIHCVKTFFPFKWKDIGEATEMAKAARAISSDDVVLIEEEDSLEIGGYPASVLYFANYVDNDTIIQKQYVSYLEDSHIVVYLNENFLYKDFDRAQDIGDFIIRTIRFKKVKNPLEDKEILDNAMEILDEKTKDSENRKRLEDLMKDKESSDFSE